MARQPSEAPNLKLRTCGPKEYTTTITLNGRKFTDVMLDTGAASDLVSPTVVRELNAKLQPVEKPPALGHCQEGETTPITHKVTLMLVWNGREAYRSFAVCPKLRVVRTCIH